MKHSDTTPADWLDDLRDRLERAGIVSLLREHRDQCPDLSGVIQTLVRELDADPDYLRHLIIRDHPRIAAIFAVPDAAEQLGSLEPLIVARLVSTLRTMRLHGVSVHDFKDLPTQLSEVTVQ